MFFRPSPASLMPGGDKKSFFSIVATVVEGPFRPGRGKRKGLFLLYVLGYAVRLQQLVPLGEYLMKKLGLLLGVVALLVPSLVLAGDIKIGLMCPLTGKWASEGQDNEKYREPARG